MTTIVSLTCDQFVDGVLSSSLSFNNVHLLDPDNSRDELVCNVTLSPGESAVTGKDNIGNKPKASEHKINRKCTRHFMIIEYMGLSTYRHIYRMLILVGSVNDFHSWCRGPASNGPKSQMRN